ncbi:MAG: 5-(carboxyamino)imidazole ribonucleotide synthase [Dermatophilaceae bacterium]
MTSPRRAPGGFPVVGFIGAGHLVRMCQPPAVGLSITLSVLAESAAASAALVVPSAPVGDQADVEVVRAFARECDVLTFDHEDVSAEVLAALEADGVTLRPSPAALLFAQDKLAMRRRLTEIGVACPRWTQVSDPAALASFGDDVCWPVVVKVPRRGYDGNGVRLVGSAQEAADWFDAVDRGSGPFLDGLLAEEKVDVIRELSVLVARSPSGQASAWQVVETVRDDGICTQVLAPAPGLDPNLAAVATQASLRIAGELAVTGVMAVKMFEVTDPVTGDPAYLVDELAMRPHSSGHWSIDGAVTSQFEQHLRAVLDLPLGDTRPRARWTVTGNVLGGYHRDLYPAYRHLMARDPALKIHLYGEDVRPGRTIGHVSISGSDLSNLRARVSHASDYLQGVINQ